MQERIKKFLQDIGLSEKEASVYLSLLSVDSASVIELSKATSINRTTLYPILEDLMVKKLIAEIKLDKKVRFQAEPPERIETYVQTRKNLLEEQERVLEDFIPQMRGFVRQTGERPIVKVHEGREGILRSIEEHYESNHQETEEYLIYPRDAIKDLFTPKEQDRAKRARTNRKVHMNSIFTSSEEYPSNELASRHRVDAEKFPIDCEIGIYGDIVRIHIISDNFSAIDIKSKDLATTLTSLFKLSIIGIKKIDSQ